MAPEPHPLVDLAALTHEQLEPLVGEQFHVQRSPEAGFPLTLTEAKKLGAARPGQRAPFSLIFRPTDPQFHAPQQIYSLVNPRIGRLDLFLVPIRPDSSGARFEAVFT